MGRAIILAASLGALSIGLAGCGGSMSMPSFGSGGGGGWFSSEPAQAPLQLDSRPAGAQATTSIGPGCRTPCTVQVPVTPGGFSVTFTLDRHTPQTIPVEIVTEGTAELDDDGQPIRIMGEPRPSPNPVFAALEPSRPTRGKAPPKRQQAAAPPPKAAPKAAPSPSQGTAFPPPPPGGSVFPSR